MNIRTEAADVVYSLDSYASNGSGLSEHLIEILRRAEKLIQDNILAASTITVKINVEGLDETVEKIERATVAAKKATAAVEKLVFVDPAPEGYAKWAQINRERSQAQKDCVTFDVYKRAKCAFQEHMKREADPEKEYDFVALAPQHRNIWYTKVIDVE